jgi:hypothetical protein
VPATGTLAITTQKRVACANRLRKLAFDLRRASRER